MQRIKLYTVPSRLKSSLSNIAISCSVTASSHYALHWDRLNRAGCPEEAERTARWAEALDQAQQALRLYA